MENIELAVAAHGLDDGGFDAGALRDVAAHEMRIATGIGGPCSGGVCCDLTCRDVDVGHDDGGIGRELVRALLGAGANVMAADVVDAGLKQLVDLMEREGIGRRLGTRHLDISDPRACAETVDATRNSFGTLDILVNNGALGMGAIRDDHMTNLVGIEEITPETWDRFVAVNFSGAWYLTRAAVPAMQSVGWGRVVTVTTSFFTMLRGGFHPYGPVKAGLEAMRRRPTREPCVRSSFAWRFLLNQVPGSSRFTTGRALHSVYQH